MEKLTAVNSILISLGHRTVTSLAIPHPVKDVAVAQLDAACIRELREGYWFNRRAVTLYPDAAGIITRPTNLLAIDSRTDVEFIGQTLTALPGGSTVFTGAVSFSATILLDFDELPEAMAEYLVAFVRHSLYLTDYGMDNTVLQHAASLQEAQSNLLREVLRRTPSSLQGNRAYNRIRRAVKGF